jgi:hypothetical protein
MNAWHKDVEITGIDHQGNRTVCGGVYEVEPVTARWLAAAHDKQGLAPCKQARVVCGSRLAEPRETDLAHELIERSRESSEHGLTLAATMPEERNVDRSPVSRASRRSRRPHLKRLVVAERKAGRPRGSGANESGARLKSQEWERCGVQDRRVIVQFDCEGSC